MAKLELEKGGIYMRRDLSDVEYIGYTWEEVPGNPATRYFSFDGKSRNMGASWQLDGTANGPHQQGADLMCKVTAEFVEQWRKGKGIPGHLPPPGGWLLRGLTWDGKVAKMEVLT